MLLLGLVPLIQSITLVYSMLTAPWDHAADRRTLESSFCTDAHVRCTIAGQKYYSKIKTVEQLNVASY